MNVRRIAIGVAVGVVLALVPALVFGQGPGGEVKTESLTYRGVRANAQTDPKNHTMNRNPRVPMWGGCVPSSGKTAALHAGVPKDKIDAFWSLAQRRVGVNGTSPTMLAEMLYATMPDEKWISYVGNDPSVADRLSDKGYLLGGTMAFGDPALYGNQRIAHMVNWNHFSKADNLACVEDNNDKPGIHRWMPYAEGVRRMFDGGQGWVFAFTRLPLNAKASLLILSAALLFFAAGMLIAALAGWFSLRPTRVT